MTTSSKRSAAIVCVALTALGTANSASATTYTISGNFGSPVFAYGRSTPDGDFTPLAQTSCPTPQLSCYGSSSFGGVAKNIGATPVSAYSTVIPAGVVWIHPFLPDNGLGREAIILFIAPISGTWHVTGQAWRLDENALGFASTSALGIATLFSTHTDGQQFSEIAANSYGQRTQFVPFNVALHSGEIIEFSVSNFGDPANLHHSIGIDATFQVDDGVPYHDPGPDPRIHPGTVPEPASWAMLLGGFGLVGVLARRQRAIRCT